MVPVATFCTLVQVTGFPALVKIACICDEPAVPAKADVTQVDPGAPARAAHTWSQFLMLPPSTHTVCAAACAANAAKAKSRSGIAKGGAHAAEHLQRDYLSED